MYKTINIRNEQEADYKKVEAVIRESFWNLYVPGCNEHYLAHVMRSHKDFISELDLVIELDDEIIGNIMYTKTRLIDDAAEEKSILTFGPVCILPKYQRKGYGKQLIEYSFHRAIELGYDLIVIFGNPGNYVTHGFRSCKKYNVSLENDVFPTAMMVKELRENVLDGRRWVYHQSPVFDIDVEQAERFDKALAPMEKKQLVCQEEFYIYSHSIIQ